jgi:HD-like signal output (HDOD) protein
MEHATLTTPSAPPVGDPDPTAYAVVQEISHIATLPQVTLKIVQLVEDPESSAQDLNRIVANDPALGARILKVVNSAFYGLPGQIGSINRAIVLLGMNAVKNIAIAASLAKLFRGGQITPTFSARDLWMHSVAVGAGTRLLAEQVGLGLPDEAFLAGLIHDMGMMVEMQARRAKFIEALEMLEGQPRMTLRAAEAAAVGATHERFGAALCRLWKFPISFSYVTGYHHHPLDLGQANRTLACLVNIADIAAAQRQLGYTRSVEGQAAEAGVLDSLGLTNAQIEQALVPLPQAVEEVTALLS